MKLFLKQDLANANLEYKRLYIMGFGGFYRENAFSMLVAKSTKCTNFIKTSTYLNNLRVAF